PPASTLRRGLELLHGVLAGAAEPSRALLQVLGGGPAEGEANVVAGRVTTVGEEGVAHREGDALLQRGRLQPVRRQPLAERAPEEEATGRFLEREVGLAVLVQR